jgi:uncharacterized C2H2 Zn-finger protein
LKLKNRKPDKEFRGFLCTLIMDNMDSLELQKTPKNPLYYCENCGLKTDNKKDYNRHLLTAKHIKNGEMIPKDYTPEITEFEKFVCVCGKVYKYRQGLYKHNRVCKKTPNPEKNPQNTKKIPNILNGGN